MKKLIIIIFLLLILYSTIDAKGVPTTGTFTPINNNPSLGIPDPANNSETIIKNPIWSIQINDTFGSFNWTLECNNTQNNNANNDINGTKTLSLTNLTYTTYTIWVNITNANITTHYWFQFTVIEGFSGSFTYTIKGSIVTATPTIYNAIRYKWSIEDFAETEWIPIADIHNYQVVLPDDKNYKITLTVENATASMSFTRIVSIKISVPVEPEPIPDPEPEPDEPKVRNVFEDTGIANWIISRNVGEFAIMLLISIFILLTMFRRRKKKYIIYPIKKEKLEEKIR